MPDVSVSADIKPNITILEQGHEHAALYENEHNPSDSPVIVGRAA